MYLGSTNSNYWLRVLLATNLSGSIWEMLKRLKWVFGDSILFKKLLGGFLEV